MKAIYFEEHGDVGVLRYADLPNPVPKHGEALVRVKAVALNHLDIWVRKGWEGLHLPMPHIGGADVAGEIVSVHANSSWTPGTRVIINPGISTTEDEWTRRGEESTSPGYHILGEGLRGGMAEYVTVPTQNLFKLPDEISFEEGAAPLLVGTACWRMLFSRGHLTAGETVLIVGSGGGVNSHAILFAKAAGATVYVLCGGPKKCKMAQALGADGVIDYQAKNTWPVEVLKLTKGRGADLVIDNVGARTFANSLRSVRPGGRIVTVGNTSGAELKIDNRMIFTKQISVIGSHMGSKQDFLDSFSFMQKAGIKPVIDRVEPLSKGIEMIQYLEKGDQFGKIVLVP